jgi:4-hydroxy-2-oxoheptanedioate aldolase
MKTFLKHPAIHSTTFTKGVIFGAAVFALFVPRPALAQSPPMHLNPMVEKLSQGKPVFGISTADFSPENAHALVRADIDFVRLEMEHAPMDFETLRNFLVSMIDKESIIKKGNAQLKVAPISRFSPFGREPQAWIEKQALDIGLMGIVFNGVDNKEQALAAVRNMRYPQRKGSPQMEPAGLRGYGPGNAQWFWGISNDMYMEHADVWPLNPKGDLLAIIMIETVEGLKNIDEIASVPGVGMIFPGSATDLYMSMGVAPDSPEREAALQRILKSCLAHNVPCGIASVTAADVPKRLKEGWKYMEFGSGAVSGPVEAALAAGHAASR